MLWIEFSIPPPTDTELLVYYENGPLDKGYINIVVNRGGSYRLPEDKIYCMKYWIAIPRLPE